MGNEFRDAYWSSRDFHDIIIIHKGFVEEIDEASSYFIYYLDSDSIVGCAVYVGAKCRYPDW